MQDTVNITRIFEFPRETVFRMWTDSARLAEWWGPEGSVTILAEVDAKLGGSMRVDQRNSDGSLYSFRGTIEKVAPSELLVYRHVSPATAGFSPWEALHTVTFEELGPKRTLVTAVTGIVASPEGERESLKKAYRAGWGQSLNKLQRALA